MPPFTMNNLFLLEGNIYKTPMTMFKEDEKGYWVGSGGLLTILFGGRKRRFFFLLASFKSLSLYILEP